MVIRCGLTLVAAALCLTQVCVARTDADWAIFKSKYGKTYFSIIEDLLRQFNWQENHKAMNRHNELFLAGKTSYYMEENKYTDMSPEEFRQKLLGHVMPKNRAVLSSSTEYSTPAAAIDLPESVDWRQKGYVTKVKDQGPCGSCWAFSTTGGLEGQHFRATGRLVNLSESNLIDCTRHYGNLGCRGGLMDNAYQYIIDNGGIDTEASYPYDPSEGLCFFTEKNIGATMSSIRFLPHGNETALQEAVAKVGPVSVAVNADDFFHYGGGVFDSPDCEKGKLDHAVLVVGYGHDTKSGLDYWIVKNSWSDSWGMRGYIWMARNRDNQCGIASMAMYPVV